MTEPLNALRFHGEAVSVSLAAGVGVEVLEASGDRRKLAEADRRDLLARVRAGEHVELSFSTRGFYQSKEPNRNFLRIRPGALAKLAKSFAGQPFLRDHGQRSLEDRGGTITQSALVKLSDDEVAIDMTVKAVKPWAVEGLLDGTIDRFSVGFVPIGPVLCSVHKTALLKECTCWPGDMSGEQAVEALFTAADGVELSAVNVPAIPEAQGVEIRAQLSRLAEMTRRENAPAPQKEKDMNRIATQLGLGSTATEDEVLPVLRKLIEDKAVAESKLALEVAARGLIEGRLAEVEAQRLAAEAATTATKVEVEIEKLYATGRLPITRDGSGVRVPHAIETSLRDMVQRLGFDAFASYAASLPKVVPVDVKLQLSREPSPASKIPQLANPAVRSAALAGGVTEEDILKYGGLGVLAEGSV